MSETKNKGIKIKDAHKWNFEWVDTSSKDIFGNEHKSGYLSITPKGETT